MKRTRRVLFMTCLISLCMCFSVLCFAGDGKHATEGKRVLFISSYSYAWETVPQQIDGIRESFGDDVDVDYKFMDTKNLQSEESGELFYQSMRQFLSEVKPYDGVIAGDDAAFQFVLAHREELFDGIPFVFEGVNDVSLAEEASKNPMTAGVIENLSYTRTIQLACELYPDATKIVAVLDDSISGQGERNDYFSHRDDFPQLEFSEINASELSRAELEAKVGALGDDTILLYILCSYDKDGTAYTAKDAVSMISQAADIPLFSVVPIGMGNGMLGGEIVAQDEMGYQAAEMMKRFLSSVNPASIEIENTSPRQFEFDENVMRRFGIKNSQMPEGSVFLNHRETFYERNRQMIYIAIVIIFLLCVIIWIVARDNIKRRKINQALSRAKQSMEYAACFDTLTRLKNRRMFVECLDEKINRRQPFGMILFDIDNFKHVNDTLGHNNGDVVLKELGKRVLKLEDDTLAVYRLAGDEFTAVITSGDPECIRHYAEAIQHCFDHAFVLEGEDHMLHSSIGVAMYPQDADTSQEIVAAADHAMYYVKKHGKGQIAFYDKAH